MFLKKKKIKIGIFLVQQFLFGKFQKEKSIRGQKEGPKKGVDLRQKSLKIGKYSVQLFFVLNFIIFLLILVVLMMFEIFWIAFLFFLMNYIFFNLGLQWNPIM